LNPASAAHAFHEGSNADQQEGHSVELMTS
jgi:hypothetical protein